VLAMQYSIQLPVNYDVAQIRERVNKRSKLFDDHGGLVHKSFLYNEKEKLYAPFYVWKDVIEAQKFLLDDLFKGVVATFNRCRVRSWFVIHNEYGNRSLTPTFALREVDSIDPEEKLDHYLEQEKKAQEELLKDPNLYMQIVALDADRWEILRFSLWKDKESAPKAFSDSYIPYEVLHVSEPQPETAKVSYRQS
jgi:hypothetical protein